MNPDIAPTGISGSRSEPSAGIRFVDLVDVASLRALMESFQKVIGIANAVIDLDGEVISHAGWQDLCTQFHRVHPETRRRCTESDTSLAGSMTRGEHFAVYRCLNGLVDAAAPIVVDGRHMANVFTGQFFVEPPDLEFFRRQAKEFGFDEQRYLEAVARIPVIPQQRVEAITGFYAQFAQLLAANGVDRLHQVAAEQKLKEANRGLEQRTGELELANKELEDFSYSMSHDMRTPLRAIDGFAQLLVAEHSARLDAEGLRLLKVVRDNAQRMGCQIDDILRFLHLRKRRMEYGSVDIAPLAREVIAELQAAAPARRLRLEIGPLPPAWGDRDMLRQLLLNLLSNAVKFSPAEAEALIEMTGTAGHEYNVYSMQDHGVGFDMQYIGKLFKVFERVHPTGMYQGTGIGLAMVKRIVERHGGRVWAESAGAGRGSTFSFALPKRRSPPAAA